MSSSPALPVDSVRPQVIRLLGSRSRLVLIAPTGSGKSTQVPRWCADEGCRTLVVEPRRVACRSLARYVAGLEGAQVGEGVGYAIRHEDRLSDQTRIAFVTPGVALRILRDDALGDWDAVILDEFHERRADTDLLLALLLERHKGPLAVMSATLDGQRIARHIGGELITAQGRLHDVEVSYLGDVLQPTPKGLAGRVVRGIHAALGQGEGDVLVFLPGKGEIAEVAESLRSLPKIELLRLHGDLPSEEQDRAFTPGRARRVILSTNVAETSVTLPRIGAVVDSGLVRRTTWHQGMPALGLFPIAADSAEQRSGRAGRLGPGRCIRLWESRGILEPRTPPEIHREDLSDLVLLVASLGSELRTLPFLDRPREHEIAAARSSLQRLGALDDHGVITDHGRRMVRLPLSPWFARALTAIPGEPEDHAGETLEDQVDLIAVVSQGRPLFLRRAPDPDPASLTHAGVTGFAMVRGLREGNAARDQLNPGVLREARRTALQLRRALGLSGKIPTRAPDRRRLCRALLHVLPMAAFTPRRRSDAWANGLGAEVVVPESLGLPTEIPAVLVLDSLTIEARRGRFTTMASCVLPCTLADLRDAGVGKTTISNVAVERGQGVCCFVRSHGATVLKRWTEIPEGDDAVECLSRLIKEGRALPGAWDRLKDRISAWNLSCLLRSGGQHQDPNHVLRDRLVAAGVSSGADLPLLVENDLSFEGLSPEEQASLDSKYPRRLAFGDGTFAVRYDPVSRTVTMDLEAGRETTPRRQYLPAWPGWRVRVKLRNRVVEI